MAKCETCGKGPMFGNRRSHSLRATRHKFKPNLQKIRVSDGGSVTRKTVCTGCIRSGKVVKG